MKQVKNRLKIYFTILIILTAAFLIFNVYNYVSASKASAVGKAFYLTEEGDMAMTASAKELPQEIASVNIVFWSGFLVIFLVLLFTMRFWVKEEESKKKTD